MSCRDFEALLVEQQDGRLDPATEVRLESHLESCAACRERASMWRALVPAMRQAAPPAPSAMRARRMEVEIERQLAGAAPPRARPVRRLAWIGSLTTAAVAAALLFTFWPRRSPVPVVTPEPPAFATVTAATGPGPVVGARLAAGAQLAVPESAELALQLSALAKLRVVGPASLAIGGEPSHVRVTLATGRVEAEVAHRRAQETFVIEMPDGRVEVRGTRFAVVASPTGSSVRVDEGRVAVFDRQGGEHAVSAGETYTLPGPATAHNTEEPPARAREQCNTPPVDCARVISSARRSMRTRDYSGALALLERASGVRSGCPRPSCAGEIGYLRAEALRLAGQLESAVTAYRALDGAGALPATRQNARYAAAQLERRLGRISDARADYEAALRVLPMGALREEAMLGAMEMSDKLGDAPAALTAARRYLAAFPTGLGAAQARSIASRGSSP